MYRIKEESSGKKTVEEIREGSIVRRAEDDSLYKFIGLAKNTSSCEYEVVLMALSGDYGLYTVPVKDFTKIADFGSHQDYAYETCRNLETVVSSTDLSIPPPAKKSLVVSKREAFRGFFFMYEKKEPTTAPEKLPLLSHSMRSE